MIYLNDFGWRLGNQLFQIAAGHALAKRKGDQLVIPEWPYAKHFRGPFTIGENRHRFAMQQNGFHYTPINYNGKLDVGISGYFQSEKYFACYEDEIRSLFAMNQNSDVREEVDMNASAMAGQGQTCSVHIRRGDFLLHPNEHPLVPADWYVRAMNCFHPDTVFWIFSDDIEWVKRNIHAPNVCYQHSSDVSDFFTMSLCTHHIIANSTFSWWAAWLNPSRCKKVIAPKQWFGPTYGGWNTRDLYPQNWIVV